MRSCVITVLAALAPVFAAGAQPVIAVFDAQRQGSAALGISNSSVSEAHAAIVAAFPTVVFRQVNTLTSSGLDGANMVILVSGRGPNLAIVPLTSDEQAALSAFVDSGGGAVILCDNDSFNGGASDPANESLADPFGVDCTGTGAPFAQTATVLDPAGSIITDGPFGFVTVFSVGWSGWFNSFGPDMRRLANLNQNGQAVLLERPRSTRQACGSGGGITLFADATWLHDGYFTEPNSILLRNAIAHAWRAVCPDFDDDGFVTGLDFDAFVAAFEAGDSCADFDSDGFITGLDFDAFVIAFEAGC